MGDRVRSRLDPAQPPDPQIRQLPIHPCADLHRGDIGGVDLQINTPNTHGEEKAMSAFLGTVWFMALVGAAGFVAGMIFKRPFLKLVTGGKYAG